MDFLHCRSAVGVFLFIFVSLKMTVLPILRTVFTGCRILTLRDNTQLSSGFQVEKSAISLILLLSKQSLFFQTALKTFLFVSFPNTSTLVCIGMGWLLFILLVILKATWSATLYFLLTLKNA